MKNENEFKEDEQDVLLSELPKLSVEQQAALEQQNKRLVPPMQASKMVREARRHWDLFYKRNGDRFFKTRHWILREFPELRTIKGGFLEAGCGTGALLFPLGEELPDLSPMLACDLSPRAIEMVQSHPQFCEGRFRAFQIDLCDPLQVKSLQNEVGGGVEAVTAVFLLSALPPSLQSACVRSLALLLRPGGMIFFRDYARHDIAQIRFGPGHKIQDNLYLRQDGTTSYFFTTEEIDNLLTFEGLEKVRIGYVERRTTNVKQGLDVPRLFLQACYRKPISHYDR